MSHQGLLVVEGTAECRMQREAGCTLIPHQDPEAPGSYVYQMEKPPPVFSSTQSFLCQMAHV